MSEKIIFLDGIPHKKLVMILVDLGYDEWTSKTKPEMYVGIPVNFNHNIDSEIGIVSDVFVDDKNPNIVYGELLIRKSIFDNYIDRFTSCSVEIWRNPNGDVYIPTAVSLLTYDVEPEIEKTKDVKIYSQSINNSNNILNTICRYGDNVVSDKSITETVKEMLGIIKDVESPLKEELSKKKVELEKLKSEYNKLKDELNIKDKEIETIKSEYSKLKEEISIKDKELETIKSEYSQIKEELEKQNEIVKKIIDENKQLKEMYGIKEDVDVKKEDENIIKKDYSKGLIGIL